MQESEQGSLSKNTPITIPAYTETEDQDFDEPLFLPTNLPQRQYSAPPPREETLSFWTKFGQTLSLSGQIAATSLVNSLSDSCKVYLIAYGGETAVAAVTVMAIIEWCPTILGANFQAVATLVSGISSPNENRPNEIAQPAMLGPSTRSSLLSQELINSNLGDVGQIFRDGLKIAAVFTVPLELMFWFSGGLLELIRQPVVVAALAQIYCRANMWGIPAYLGGLVCLQLANAIGKAHVVLGLSVGSGVLGNALGYVLGVRLFGPNLWGVGIGIATQYWLFFGSMMTYFYISSSTDPRIRSFKLFQLGGSTRSYFTRILSLGWGVSFFYGFELGTYFMAIKWVGEKLGTRVLATQGVIQSWAFLLIVPAYAVSESANIFVSRFFSMRRFKDMRSFGRLHVFNGAVYGGVCLVAFEMWPEALIKVIIGSNNPQLIADSAKVMRWAAPAFLIDPIRIIYSGADRGLERTLMTVISSVVGLGVIGLSSSYFLSYILEFDLIGSAIGRDIGMLAALLGMMFSWEYGAAEASGYSFTMSNLWNWLPCCSNKKKEKPLYSSSRHRFFPEGLDEEDENRILMIPDDEDDEWNEHVDIPLRTINYQPQIAPVDVEALNEDSPQEDDEATCTML
jgi:MATE family multidrug resistance protein